MLIKQTSVSIKSAKALQNNEAEEDVEIATPKKRCISPEERKQIIKELRLVPKKIDYWWINVNYMYIYILYIYIPKKVNKLLMNWG